jgi:hypothetical protein
MVTMRFFPDSGPAYQLVLAVNALSTLRHRPRLYRNTPGLNQRAPP